MRRFCKFLFPVLLAACAAEDQQDVSNINVYGGEASLDGEWSSAVALLRGGRTFCTGTVVHPRLVITAAHCVTGAQTETGSSIRILVGKNERSGKTYTVERIKYFPGYRDDAQTDIAYLRLSQPVENIEIIPVLSDESEINTLLANGAKSVLAGFGTTERGQIGIKHDVTTTVGRPQGGALFIGGNGKDTCQGDSGGPAYGQLPNGEWRVYGITSRGNGCSGGGQYARMHDQICWIQKDSGIAIPGVKKDCQGVEKIETRSPRQIFLSVGGSEQAPELAIAAGSEISEVSICKADIDTCRRTLSKDVTFSLTRTRSVEKTSFFRSGTSPDALREATFTLMGFDQHGNLVAANPVKVSRR